MPNISKQKREDLIAKIKEINAFITRAEDDENKQSLLTYLLEIEKDIKGKRYGLVFEEHREEIDETLDTHTPVLTERKDLYINNGGQVNFLIEGDNLASLKLLEKTHKGKIDVIYIDPPYNTGAKDWKYDNDYVDQNDTFRHSKWLSFMEKRLIIAKKLLTENGVLICAIDENELYTLGLLIERIFGQSYENHGIAIIHNPGGIQGKNFSYVHEYAIFVIPQGVKSIGLHNRETNPDIRPLRDVSTGNHLRIDAKNCFYPIFIKDNQIVGFGDVCPDDFHPTSVNEMLENGTIAVYPIDPSGNERKWVFARHTVESIVSDLKVEFNKKRKIYDIIRVKTKFTYKTIWSDKEYNSNIYGTKLLKKIIPDCGFNFPKSFYNTKDCIGAVITPKNAIVLDFFAGSGTTGHATLELNEQDGGNRRFILCTNNENNICEEVTYERVKTVITGKRKDGSDYAEPKQASLKYYKIGFVPISERVYYEYANDLLKHIRELVELENGINFTGNAEISIVLSDEELAEFCESVVPISNRLSSKSQSEIDTTIKCRVLYLGHDILPTAQQQFIIESRQIELKVIPNYYYKELGS
jgi:adenine-specific DNA-methyltransferase